MRRILPMIGALLLAVPAHADFQLNRWSTNVEDDPFEGKGRFSMAYFDSLESGVIINCQQASDEVTFRIAFPFDSTELGAAYDGATVRLKVDKFDELTATAEAITLQSGNAGIDADIYGYEAWQLLENLRDGVSKLYIKLGNAETISIPLTGSTRAAKEAIPFCLTENPRKKKSIDWEKEKSVWGEDASNSPAPKEYTQEQINTMHHIASARAVAALCPSLQPNEPLIEAAALVWKLDLSDDSADRKRIDEDMNEQMAGTSATLAEAGENAELIACSIAEMLYGSSGTNVKNMVIPADSQ